MDELSRRIAQAKQDTTALNQLISDYLPFIKKEIGSVAIPELSHDDKISLGMMVFMNCVQQYDPERGGFLRFTSFSIRNRLIDEIRKSNKRQKNMIYFQEDGDAANDPLDELVSLQHYNQIQEQQLLYEEIQTFSELLVPYGFTFFDLEQSSPKQKRSRELCRNIAYEIFDDADMRNELLSSKRIPQKELAKRLQISEKTVEKYRRYIISLVLLLHGEHPAIAIYAGLLKEVDR